VEVVSMGLESFFVVLVVAAAGRIVGRVLANRWEAAQVRAEQRADDLRALRRRLY
jgi:hypothetical protein